MMSLISKDKRCRRVWRSRGKLRSACAKYSRTFSREVSFSETLGSCNHVKLVKERRSNNARGGMNIDEDAKAGNVSDVTDLKGPKK